MPLKVDQDLCVSCGLCVELCPDVFELDEQDKAQVIAGADEGLECVDDAIDQCPVSCISRD